MLCTSSIVTVRSDTSNSDEKRPTGRPCDVNTKVLNRSMRGRFVYSSFIAISVVLVRGCWKPLTTVLWSIIMDWVKLSIAIISVSHLSFDPTLRFSTFVASGMRIAIIYHDRAVKVSCSACLDEKATMLSLSAHCVHAATNKKR